MNILNNTQLDTDLTAIQKLADSSQRRVIATARTLTKSFEYFWSLPDDRLQAVLQKLVDEDKLTGVFEAHQLAATNLNAILANLGMKGQDVPTVPAREFVVEDEVVTVTPLPEEVESE